MSTAASPGYRFDGRHAEATPVTVRVDDRHLVVETTDGAVLDRVLVHRVAVSELFEHAPRLVRSLYHFFRRMHDLEARLGVDNIPDFMSTHPATEERLERPRREIR